MPRTALVKPIIFLTAACLMFFCIPAWAQDFQAGGFTLLATLETNLNGSGIRVGQAESPVDTNGDWEVNPASVDHPVSLFTYYTNGGFISAFTNSLGGESWHADNVGQVFYDQRTGMATNVAHVDNAEADYYYGSLIAAGALLPSGATDAIVNQSFTFGALDAGTQETVDSQYDNYSMKYKQFFVSAACNFDISQTVSAPGTSYNCISVGAYQGDSSVGPTIDNGRCKPDIVAFTTPWSPETSFSTPIVAGAAAILMQAGLRGDGGPDTNSAANMLTVKALLMNGAVKPAGWTNIPPAPLDFTNGAGVLNVFNSYEQLAGGKHGYNFTTNISVGALHPPIATAASIPVLNGWDCNTNTSSLTNDEVSHYFFNVTNGTGRAFTLTSTLVWNRHYNANYSIHPLGINNLGLYLYNAANSNLVASSTSVVDNVQHLFVPMLPQGRYDLQVWKAGGASIVTSSEPYALAWEIFLGSLSVTNLGGNVMLSWPAYPAGFTVAGTTSLNPPVTWSTNNLPPSFLTNGQNAIILSATNSEQFFRLQTPDF